MRNPIRYFSAVVADNEDPDELGGLRLIIPGILDGETVHPDWIRPRVTAGAGAGAGWFWVPPVDAIVVVERDADGELRWTGGTWGAVNTPPAFLASNYPRRGGFTSPSGVHAVALDDDAGLLVLVPPPGDPEGIANFLALDGAAGEAKIGLVSGATWLLSETQVLAANAAGDTLLLDAQNGIMLTHQGGAEFVSLSAGVAQISGGEVQLVGGTVGVVGQGGIVLTSDPTGLAPTEPPILGTSFLTDLATFLTGAAGDAALSPGVAAAAAAFLPKVQTALGAGAPYLSTVVELE